MQTPPAAAGQLLHDTLRPNKRRRTETETLQCDAGQALCRSLPTLRERLPNLCDVVLIADDGTECSAHRIILAASSSWFEALFGRWETGGANKIDVHEVSGEALAVSIDFCYTGAVAVSGDNVVALLHASRQLQLEAMGEMLCKWVEANLSSDNALTAFTVADRLQMERLRSKALKLIWGEGATLLQAEGFVELDLELLQEVLQSNSLPVQAESEVFEAVVRWVKHDRATRDCHLVPLLRDTVRLLLMPGEEIIEKVQKQSLLQESQQARDLIVLVFQYLSISPQHRLRLLGMPARAVKRHGAAVVNGKIYVAGGYDGTQELSSMECYDPEAQQWSAMPEMPAGRSNATAAVVDGKIYVVGGHDGTQHLSSMGCYDPEAQQWSAMPEMSTRRSFATAAVVGGKIYVAGGHDGAQRLTGMECYDPEARQWSAMPEMSTRRSAGIAAVVDGKIYVAGGLDGGQALTSMECYDPEARQWSAMPAMRCRRKRAFICAVGTQKDSYAFYAKSA